ncbi:MAG: V-type ATP synthase subunit F [Clostridia bacterium]|nr:V-type ATP synthase subunit F [Clostridia bacterium]
MHKIAVMGDRDSVSGFACLGLETFFINDKATGERKLKELSNNGYAIIFITEALASELSNEIEKYKDGITPAIILIPGVSGNTGEGMSSVLRSVERAVGSQLLD